MEICEPKPPGPPVGHTGPVTGLLYFFYHSVHKDAPGNNHLLNFARHRHFDLVFIEQYGLTGVQQPAVGKGGKHSQPCCHSS
jgi:hypothetical protein